MDKKTRPYWSKFGMFGPVLGILSTIILVIFLANAPPFTPWGASGVEALLGNPAMWLLFLYFFVVSSVIFFVLLAGIGFVVGKIKTVKGSPVN